MHLMPNQSINRPPALVLSGRPLKCVSKDCDYCIIFVWILIAISELHFVCSQSRSIGNIIGNSIVFSNFHYWTINYLIHFHWIYIFNSINLYSTQNSITSEYDYYIASVSIQIKTGFLFHAKLMRIGHKIVIMIRESWIIIIYGFEHFDPTCQGRIVRFRIQVVMSTLLTPGKFWK